MAALDLSQKGIVIRMAAGGTALLIIVAFLLDCAIGDPQNPFHPMRFIGKGISAGVRVYKAAGLKSAAAKFIAGAALSIVIIGLSFAFTRFVTWGLYSVNYWAGFASEAVICYFLIAPRALRDESTLVYRNLAAGDLEGARKNLSFIVGRDTAALDVPCIVKAAVETISENLPDGVIAPLIFICLGGAPLGMAYKAINTLDSMIGYKNDEYMHFGKFAARLDDIVNFIPARISALLLIFGCLFTGGDIKGAARIFARDRHNHPSPNSAQTEAACAGALGLQLGGGNYYGGVLVHKPAIGDAINEPAPKHIAAANRLMYAASIGAAVLLAAGSYIFSYLSGNF